MNPKRLILPGIGVAVVVLIAWYMGSRPVPVDVAVSGKGAIREFVEEEGETRVKERYVLSAPVAGRLLRVRLEEGDAVKAGDVVAEIDPLALTSRVTEAEARVKALEHRLGGVDRRRPKPEELERARLLEKRADEQKEVASRRLDDAKAAHGKAVEDANRARRLYSEKTITASEREDAELGQTRAEASLRITEVMLKVRSIECDTARLETKILEESGQDLDFEEAAYREQVREAKAGLAVLSDDLERARIVAPSDGVVLRRHVESETMLAAGAPILEIGDVSTLEVTADFLSEDAARMREGMKVAVTGRALGGGEVLGRLDRIRPGAFTKVSSLGVEQQRVTVVVAFDAGEHRLGDAWRVDVAVILDERSDALLVPEAALFRSEGEWKAFLVNESHARLVAVKTGLRDGRQREVIEGLQEGDRVVLFPDDQIEDGAKVAIRNGGE